MPASRPSTPSQRPGTPATSVWPTPQSTPNGEVSPFQLDVTKLHSLPSEQQSLYLFTFTADLVRRVEALDDSETTAQQELLKKELFSILNLPQPAPTRVIRNSLCRCFRAIFTKGNRKSLYETINDSVAILNAGLKEKDLRVKHAALSCLGAVFEAAGDSAISLSPLACTASLKLIKPASSDAGLRGAIYKTLTRITKGIGVAIDEDIARSIWKQARNAACGGDRSLLVQTNACSCLEQLVRSTPYFDNSNDFEKLQTAIWKALDSPCVPVRRAAAACLAAVLVKCFSNSAKQDGTPKLRKPKKTRKANKGEEVDDVPDRTASPAPDRPATALSFSLVEVLRILSTQYGRPAISNRIRAGVVVTYVKVLRALGESVVEQNYSIIARHLFTDILSHPALTFGNTYRLHLSRKLVQIILESVMGKMLGETAQINACRFLLNDIIKDYPQAVRERPEPGKQILTGALSALSALMRDADAAIGELADLIREALLQVLQHPSLTVQVHAARALKTFVLAVPLQLLPTLTICMNSVSRELGLLAGPRQSPRRCIGYAYGLAATLSTSCAYPLYGSVDVYARILQQATTLLRTSGSSDLRISSCQLQVAWIMIGGLMSLGPTFVKIHLPQLMLLWKNALPKPLPRDNMSSRKLLELSYLSHVRDCALGSIKAFLTFNQRLLTSDISRRLSAMLENTVAYLQSLPDKTTSEDPATRLSPALQLQDYEVMVRRRVFQCFSQLLTMSPVGSLESTAHSTILPMAVASFSDAEFYAPSSLSVAIASAAATFETIWEVADDYGFGVTGLVCALNVSEPMTRRSEQHWSSRTSHEDLIDQSILSPVTSTMENDGSTCYLDASPDDDAPINPPGTEVVNAAICAFGLCLPLQPPKVQESSLEQLTSSISASALQKDPARKAAIYVNTALALRTACKVSSGEIGSARGDLRHQNTERGIQSLLHMCLMDTDESVRMLAASALGHLCSSSGNTFTAGEVTFLTETIVKNREPHVRAGCAVALACIHSQLGGMAAGFHMKSIVGILMSLAADTHPLVHAWALDALATVADSAGLHFSSYVTNAIGMLSQIYVSDTHSPEMAYLASSNMSISLPTSVTSVIARGVDAITNVLGPDLQDMTKSRDMVLTLVQHFSDEVEDVGLQIETLRCMEHLSLFAPGHMNFEEYVKTLQADIDSESPEIADRALYGLFGLMRRDAGEVVQTARPGLEDRLWEFLNNRPAQKHVRAIFINWLQQTGGTNPAGWIQTCNTILTKTKARADVLPATVTAKSLTAPDLQDEEVAGFASAAGVTKEEEIAAPSSTQDLMRWQVRLFAMECLHDIISIISKEASVSIDESTGEIALQHKVGDVVRIAFSASTAGVTALRVLGLKIIGQILQMLGKTPDPDFPDAMLLEQYQAQISSALTPAFAMDSSPELAAEAINVCATFISTGIVTDIDRMGRILKLLVSALDSFARDSETSSIGDLKALSSNAQVMVRMSVFSAWAELQIASTEQRYLVDVVKPHIAQLVPLWLTSLREYARLRFEPDISATTGSAPSGDLDMVYAAFNRQTLLGFYQDSWLSLVDAIASLIDEDSEFVFNALDGRNASSPNGKVETSGPNGVTNGIVRQKNVGINYRQEPVAFFFVLFGLAFESLAVRSVEDDIVIRRRNLDILQALKKILRPSVSGNAVYQEVIFAETVDLFDRMVLTESLGVQAIVVEIVRNLCLAHPSSRQGEALSSTGEVLSDDIEQLFELTRIIVLVLAGLIPGLSENPVSAKLEASDEAVGLVQTSLQALVDVSEVFPSIIKTDLHATILHIFVTVLGTGTCQAAVVPQSLPIFRRFITSLVEDDRPETQGQLRNTLARMSLVLKNAQKREAEASLACEKNCLLAITILLSSAANDLPDSIPLVAKFALSICECLEVPSTSRVAAGCIRTLLSAKVASAQLLSQSIVFLLTPSDLEGLDESKTIVAQTLVMHLGRAPEGRHRAAMATLLIKALLSRVMQDSSIVSGQETATRLLEVAAADNGAFRATVASMSGEEKQALESILKSATGTTRGDASTNGVGEPTIALKMDFGG